MQHKDTKRHASRDKWFADNRERIKALKHAAYAKANPGAKTLEQISAERIAKASRTEKTCKDCHELKPIGEFGLLKNAADGRRYECVDCRRAAWARDNPKKPAAPKATYDRFIDTPQYAAHRKWVKAHPEHAKRLKREGYHRAKPEAKTIAEVVAAKEAKALRTEKPCKRCGIVKPISSFTPNKGTADNHQYQCKECINKVANVWSAANKDKTRATAKRWHKRNPDKVKEIGERRRIRERGVPGSHTIAEWKAMCRRFGGRCVRCGAKGKITKDHIIPITLSGSSDSIENLQPLCYSCNSSKGNRHTTDYRNSPFVSQGQSPFQF